MATPLFPTAGSVKSLRQYWKASSLPTPANLAGELLGQSDRAAVILAASLLDDALAYRLGQCLAVPATPAQLEVIFRYEGPLGSFSSRIDVASLFGFIDVATRSQLSDIREMRNACAHSTQPMSFQIPQLATVAKRLFHPTGHVHLTSDAPEAIKQNFVLEFLYIHNILIAGSREEGIRSMQESIDEARAGLFP
jgi:hypothetical protein